MLGTSFSREEGEGGSKGESGWKIDKDYDHKIFFNLHPPSSPTGEKNVPRLRPYVLPRLCPDLGLRRYRRQAIGFIITSLEHRCSTCVLSQPTTSV